MGTTRIRTVITVLAALVTLGTFLFFRGKTVDARTPLALPLAGWWISPLLVYHMACRTVLGSLLIGVSFLAALVAFLIVLYGEKSSTAAIGFFTIPMVLWIGMVLAVALERLLVRPTLGRSKEG